jgi:YesN/AraC family two-component response regulator
VTTNNSDKPVSILFVEDDEVTLWAQTPILTARFPDVEFYTAVNGRLGLEAFQAHMPDIVITDINMSEMNGVQLCCYVRELKPDTKFIAITGNSIKYNLQISGGKELEFYYIIVKPVVFQELFAVIEQCIGEIYQQTDSNIVS